MRPSPPPPALGDFPSSPSPFSCTPSPLKSNPCFLSEDDVQLFLRNRGRWEYMYDPRVPSVSQDCAADDFSWEAANLAGPSRCSLLIHEVSLLVGLAPDDGYPSPDDACLLVPDGSKQVSDILPLTLTPTKSLAPRKHKNTRIPHHTDTNVPSNIPMFPDIIPHPDIPNPPATFHTDNVPLVRPTDPVTPPPRYKHADGVRPTISPRRRQGQVFLVEPPLGDASRRTAVHLDETFLHPREPPPKPIPNSPANRCSSLDRLERSLLKLQAHAPHNHRKSQSEGDHALVARRKDKRPSLPPPQRLRKEQSSHEFMLRDAPRPALGRHTVDPPPPVPRPTPGRQHVAFPAVPSDKALTPGSFMDMAEETLQKRQASFPQLKSRERMKHLVGVAKKAGRGVIALGKTLTGSTKPAQETTTSRTPASNILSIINDPYV